MATYVPRVLICGDVEEFKEKIGNKPAEIVGQIKYEKTGDYVKLFFGEQSLTGKDIKSLLDGVADYLIFTNVFDYGCYFEKFPRNTQVISLEAFIKKFHSNFFSVEVWFLLKKLLSQIKNAERVLDFDAFFAKSGFHTKGDFNATIEGITDNRYPIMENIYGKIYRSFDECKFHNFNAIILTKERTSEEFIDVIIETEALTENLLAFVRKNSELETWLASNENIFARIKYFKTTNGAWCIIKKNVPPADVGIYVVTHKDAKLSALPKGYKFIHAGHALAKNDFGYAGDDTGDNISQLNTFLDEVTALYWIWKNTKHTHTGFVHYRRFFTNTTNQKAFNRKKILSAEEILKILSEYDFIVQQEGMSEITLREQIILSVGQPDLVQVCEKIIRYHLVRTHPDYLDAFDDVLSGCAFFSCGMHITRRNIFNAYCKWLFSFMLDATKDARDKLEIDGKSLVEMPHQCSRVMGHFAERMMTVWLMKNHLRIKTLPIIFREDV